MRTLRTLLRRLDSLAASRHEHGSIPWLIETLSIVPVAYLGALFAAFKLGL